MKQVNMWIDDNVHMLLVKEAARRQLDAGKILSVSKLAAMIVKESLNGKPIAKPDDNPVAEQQDNEQAPTEEPTQDTSANPFSDLSFD